MSSFWPAHALTSFAALWEKLGPRVLAALVPLAGDHWRASLLTTDDLVDENFGVSNVRTLSGTDELREHRVIVCGGAVREPDWLFLGRPLRRAALTAEPMP